MKYLKANIRINSLEIARFAEKQHKHVMRDIRNMESSWEKVHGSKFGLMSYKDEYGRDKPMYSLKRDECLYVVSKYNDEIRAMIFKYIKQLEESCDDARSSTDMAVVPSPSGKLSPAQMFHRSAELMLEQERKINDHEMRLEAMEFQLAEKPAYYTVAGYARVVKRQINLTEASRYGRQAAALCRREGVKMDTVNDPRFGYVNMYPMWVLEEVMGIG